MSNVSKRYAPKGKVLVSVSYNGIPEIDDASLAENMKSELQQWYGKQLEDWKILKTYRINFALPNQDTVSNEVSNYALQINENVYMCEDHLMNGSINVAMKTGRLVTDLIDQNYKNKCSLYFSIFLFNPTRHILGTLQSMMR